jgi:hypothetical protein
MTQAFPLRLFVAALLALPAATLHAQDAPRPAVQAVRIVGPLPVIDGSLDEAAWEAAPPVTGFVQQRPNPGTPGSERTEVRVLYSDRAVYVGMRLYDSAPDSIAAQLARRDATGLYSDWAHVLIDSYHDRRTAFRFSVNPRGVKRDILHFDDTREDAGWNAVWEVATQIDSLGWTAEFRIPLSQLRYRTPEPGEEVVWGINFLRDLARREERTWWAPIPPNVGRLVSLSGELHGLRDLPALRRLEIQPYTVARATRAPGDAANPFHSSTDLFATVGGDVQYGLTSDLTLTATLNPDFGQVEADPSRVNLGAFELFFPEQRPFFTEGMDIFRFGISPGGDGGEQLFYSRRIGRTPQRTPAVPGGYVDMPEAARIRGAGKVSGKTGGGWSIGLLNAITAGADARVVDAQGQLRTEPVEPLTNYGVARLSRDFQEGRSTVGGILTSTHRRIDDAALEFLPRAAHAGGVDVRHRLAGGQYQVSGWLLGSHVRGSERAISRLQLSPARFFQRPDADHVEFDPTRTSLGGWAASASLEKIGGANWQWGLLSLARSPGFEVNDLGFQQFADMVAAGGYASYTVSQPTPRLRRWNVNGSFFPAYTFGRERVQVAGNVNGSAQLHNLWSGFGGINHEAVSFSPFQLRGGPAVREPSRTNVWGGINSDSRRPLVLNLFTAASAQRETGSRTFSMSPGLTLRPAPPVSLSLGPSFSLNDNAWQYIQTVQYQDEPRYIFGRIDQTTVSLTTRLNYTFTPDLSLQLYAQPFISGAGYSEFRQVAEPHARHFDDRAPRFPDEQLIRDPDRLRYGVDVTGDLTPDFFFRDPDFNVRHFNSNAVLRWEYRPGSTLFLVWSQGRRGFETQGDFRFRRDVAGLFDVEPSNVFLIKLNYWLGM